MPISNRSMRPEVRAKIASYTLDFDAISATSGSALTIYEPMNDIKIQRIDLVYVVATNGGSVINLRVGTPSSPTLYANIAPAGSTAINTVTSVVPSSTLLVPKGTALYISPASLTAGTNTGVCAVIVHYELIDKTAV